MIFDFLQKIDDYHRKRRRRSIWLRIVSVMAAIVVFCTSYALILPAITIERDPVCGFEEHTHTDECKVKPSKEFICDACHLHGEDCYDENGGFICSVDVSIAHIHNEYCYDGETCICPLNEYVTVADDNETTPSASESVTATTSIETTVTENEISTTSSFETESTTTTAPPNVDAHLHSSECIQYILRDELDCGFTEHTHSDLCFASDDEPLDPVDSQASTVVDDEENTVVTVSGLLPQNAELQVLETTVESDELDVVCAFDIEILDEKGDQYDPGGETICVSLDSSLISSVENDLTVYYFPDDGGEPVPMKTYIQDGVLCFETTHFSKYVVVLDAVNVELSSDSLTSANPVTITKHATWYSAKIVLAAYKFSINSQWGGPLWDAWPMTVKMTGDVFANAQGIKVYRVSDEQSWQTAIETAATISGNTITFSGSTNDCVQYHYVVACDSASGGGGNQGGGDTGGDDGGGGNEGGNESGSDATKPLEGNASTLNELSSLINMASSKTVITLTGDINYTSSNSLSISRDITIDLNGHTINCQNSSASLFNIGSNGKLTIVDSAQPEESVEKTSIDPLGSTPATTNKNADGSVTLTYYVTESVLNENNPNGATIETVYKHTVTTKGAILAGSKPVFEVNGGTLNVDGGMVYGGTGRAVYSNGYGTSKINLSGGYICGFDYAQNAQNDNPNSYGGAVYCSGGTVTISDDAVLAANHNGLFGGAVACINATLNINGGVVSGNSSSYESWSSGTSADGHNNSICRGGGGIFADSCTVNMTDGYVTNNRCYAVGYWAGGGGFWVEGSTTFTMEGGYITSNMGAGGGGFRTEDTCSVRMNMYGGYVCSNLALEAEGGGITLSFGSVGLITSGYINNNRTENPIDWGGGGLFCANDAYVYVKNALITENDADGYGGGVAGCSTGRITIAINEGCAIFENTALGEHLSGSESTKNEDWVYAHESAVFNEYGYQDYFCALNSSVGGGMLGSYPANWKGSTDGVPVISTHIDDEIFSQYIMGLTSHPTQEGKEAAQQKAVEKEGVFINGNSSTTHGGGILCNGYMFIGTPDDIQVGARLALVAHKVYFGEKGEFLEMEEGQFTFEITDAETGALISRASNDTDGNVQFIDRIPFSEEGVYTYYIEETSVDNPHIVYDTCTYRMVVTVSEIVVYDEKIENLIPSVVKYQYVIDNIRVDKEVSGDWVTVIDDYDPEDTDIYTIEVDIGSESFMNMYKHETTTISIKKEWSGGQAVPITVYLLRDTTAIAHAVLSDTYGWEYTWYDLPTYDENGEAYVYEVSEEIPEGFVADYSFENQIDVISNWLPATELILGHKYLILSPDLKHALQVTQADWAFDHTHTIDITPNKDNSVDGSAALEKSIFIANAYNDLVHLKVKNMSSWLETSLTNGNQGWDTGQPYNYLKTTAGEQYASGFSLQNGLIVSSANRFIVYMDDDGDGRSEFTSVSMNDYSRYWQYAAKLYTHQVTEVEHSSTITITNHPVADVRYEINLTKVSGLDTTVPLSGAVFNLLDSNGNALWFVRTSSMAGSYKVCAAGTQGAVTDLVTSKQGKLVLKDLPAGNYTIREIQAPFGYMIAADRAVTLGGDVFKLPITIVDAPEGGYMLPETGGRGTYWYMIAGGVLLTAALFLLLYKKLCRRKEEQLLL